jgi:ketosteroid isomerase-like protein
MAQENVEKLRAFLGAWGEQRWTPELTASEDAIDMDVLDRDVLYEDTVLPDHVGEAYRGHDGVRRATQRLNEGNEWMRIELLDVLGSGDRLVSCHRVRTKARYSEIEFEVSVFYAWTFAGGKVVRFVSFLDKDRALQAAGLSG